MAVPKKRKTSSQGKQKRSHDALTKINLVKCSKCGELLQSHMACATCGYYGDKKVLDVETKLDKKLKKEEKKKEKTEE
jgi:large subunit ribosomal protein L32